MASPADICNRGLQKIGAARITSLDDQSVNARACKNAYDTLRQWLYREHPWNFAIQRFQLAASATPQPFGPANAYPLPPGWQRVLPPDPKQNMNSRDWTVEGGKLITDDGSPLNVRCVMDVTDTTLMDVSFREALAAKIGMELCEQLTQSNTKKDACAADYKDAIAAARKANAIEKVPQVSVDDTFITSRC